MRHYITLITTGGEIVRGEAESYIKACELARHMPLKDERISLLLISPAEISNERLRALGLVPAARAAGVKK